MCEDKITHSHCDHHASQQLLTKKRSSLFNNIACLNPYHYNKELLSQHGCTYEQMSKTKIYLQLKLSKNKHKKLMSIYHLITIHYRYMIKLFLYGLNITFFVFTVYNFQVTLQSAMLPKTSYN